MMVQFSTNEAISLEKQVDNSKKSVHTEQENIDYLYEINKCSKWIQNHGFKKVCLQFPDYLLPDSTEVAMRLQSILGQTVYVMGDTAYESCCVDYVAAAHINADAIIHFGPVCFSKPSNNIACLKIYEKEPLDLDHFKHTLGQNFGGIKDEIIVVVDTPFLVHLESTREALKTCLNTTVHPIDDEGLDLNGRVVVFVAENQRKILNLKLSFQSKELCYYNPKADSPTIINYEQDPKVLKRRYFLIEKIKDSATLGIIIGTLAVRNYLRVIERIKKLIRASGRKYYVISVGKPTVAKLANFPEIDVYVVISCAMNEIYDSRDFYKPIVTPYDVELALNPDASNVRFSYDYNSYLPEGDLNHFGNFVSNESDVSLITGKVRTYCPDDYNKKRDEIEASDDTQIALKDEGTIALNTNFGAGFLSERSWKGLEQNLGQDAPQVAEEGRRGIAQGYENEKS